MFAVTLIAYAQIMPSLFSANIWSNVTCVVLLAGGAVLSNISTGWNASAQYATCLLSPVAMYLGALHYISGGSVILHVTPGGAAGMLVVDTIIYVVLGNYIYAVAPGQYGVPKHPLYFIRWIWHTKQGPVVSPISNLSMVNAAGIATTSPHDRVVLRHLVKQFGTPADPPAVNRLSLSIRQGEIFALLGHNGAGKTTTMSMLTGMITPTSYEVATVDGMDIANDMDQIRQTVGLCPQFDVLIGELTARQHLEMFARLRGGAPKSEIDRLLHALDLPDTAQFSKTFSGGTKRRLSVGNALIGGASLIFLDEPSSGMDPLNRRRLWDLLKEERDKGKTLVLTTHFMEEADYLGDRIAIMSHGRLFCCDTAQNLKETYGVGYYLTLVKDQSAEAQTAQATTLIKKHLADATLHHQSSGDVTYVLPMSGLSKFGPMLTELEANLARLGFHSYGVAMNTLEDVFVSISEREDAESMSKSPKLKEKVASSGERRPLPLVNGEPAESLFQRAASVSYSARVWSHALTVFWRKVLALRRNRRMQFMTLAFPLLFIFVGVISMQPSDVSFNAQFNAVELPNYNATNLIMVNLRDRDANSVIIGYFTGLYQMAYPQSHLNIYELTEFKQYLSGSYVPLHGVSFFSGFDTPEIPGGFLFHETSLSSTPPIINYTFIANKKYSSVMGLQLIAMFDAAIEMAVRSAGNVTPIFVTPVAPPNYTQDASGSAAGASSDSPADKTYGYAQLGAYMIIAVVLLVANCVVPVADEISRGVYHTNRAHGMTALGYFLGNILFDFLFCIYPAIAFAIMISIKGVGAFKSFVLFWVLVAFLLFAVHVILQGYVLACYFNHFQPVTYTVALQAASLGMLAVPYLILLVLPNVGFTSSFVSSIKPVFLALFPASSWYHVMDIAGDYVAATSTSSNVMTFTGDRTAWSFVFLIAELAVPGYAIYRFMIDRPMHLHRWAKKPAVEATHESGLEATTPLLKQQPKGIDSPRSPAVEDEDVATERKRIESGGEGMIITQKLRKEFPIGNTTKVALANLSLGMKKGECFGLLGPNGAGKTTTCKLILKELQPTSGVVRYPYTGGAGESQRRKDDEFLYCRLGVCQQGDTLWESLTAREHMEQYLRFRLTTNYRAADWKEYIDETIERVQLEDVATKWAGRFSGGMKRKLIVCLAMYTGALSVFLDEPSTGMDPFARRALWQVILEALSDDRCVVLTTHSMEEADAVCSRIGIITGGELRCLGSSQHLKNRFGAGYVITLTTLPTADTELIDREVRAQFGRDTKLAEVLGSQRRYEVGSLPSLAAAFNTISQRCAHWGVAQYSVTQTSSLEQIFLSFVGSDAIVS